MGELQVLFYRKLGNSRAKVATIIEDIKIIFLLVEKNAFGRMDNFETKKTFERSKIFALEVCRDDSLEVFNQGEVVASNKNIININ